MNVEIEGRKIVKVREMTDAELEAEGWSRKTSVLVLDNGAKIYASQDEEGNGAGCLFGKNKEGESFYVGVG